MRRTRSAGLAVALLAGLAGPMSGQHVAASRLNGELAAGPFYNFPSQFAGPSCWQNGGALAARVGYPLGSAFAVEGRGALAGGFGDEICEYPGIPAPTDGTVFSRPIDDGIEGTTFLTSDLAIRFEPPLAFPVTPLLRAGAGRIWQKGITYRYGGAGVRARFGFGSIVASVEIWDMRFELRRELLVFRDSGEHELQEIRVYEQHERPGLITLAFERPIG